MDRPVTDYFTDTEILNMYMLGSNSKGICYICEQDFHDTHYRLRSMMDSTTIIVCPQCATDLKREAIKRRGQLKQNRHGTPLTAKEIEQGKNDRWKTPG